MSAIVSGMAVFFFPAVILVGSLPKAGCRSTNGALMEVAVLADKALLAGLRSLVVPRGSRSATTK